MSCLIACEVDEGILHVNRLPDASVTRLFPKQSCKGVGGVPVQIVSRSVVSSRCPRICMPSGILDVPEARSCVQTQRDEGMAKVMGMDARSLRWDGRTRQPSQRPPCL